MDRTEELSTTTTTLPAGPSLTGGALTGLRGIRRQIEGRDRAAALLDDQSAPDRVVRAAAAAYDAVTLTAVAAQLTRTDVANRFWDAITTITNGRNQCDGFSSCVTLSTSPDDKGTPLGLALQYRGLQGRVNLEGGRPAGAVYGVYTFRNDDLLVPDRTLSVNNSALDPPSRPPTTTPAPVGPVLLPDGILRLGLLAPLSGPQSPTGNAVQRGAQRAVDEINRAGGVLGRPVELSTADSNDPAGPPAALERLLAASVDLVIGPVDAASTAAVLPRAAAAGIPLFSPTDDTPAPGTDQQRAFFLSVAPLAALESLAVSRTLIEDGRTAPAVITAFDAQSLEVAGGVVRQYAAARTAPPPPLLPVGTGPDSVAAAVDALLATSPDSVVVVGSDDTAGAVVRTLVARGRGPSTLPTYAADVDQLLAATYVKR